MKSVFKADAEREIAETSRMERESIAKRIMTKALYIPSAEEPYLRYERLIRQEAGKQAQEIIVIKKTNDEQNYIIPEDNLRTVMECEEKIGGDHGISMNDLMYLGDINYTKTDILLQTSMSVLEELANEKILILDKEKRELHQNQELTTEEYGSFLAKVKIRGSMYNVIGKQLLNEFPELKRK